MANAGRPRGRSNKLKYATPSQQAIPRSQYNPHIHGSTQYVPPQHTTNTAATSHPRREELGVQIHDEADLVSFRLDALSRFVSNQEYLDNLTMKFIHSNKLIPPSLYPVLPKRDVNVKELKHDEIYFGDSELMKQKVAQIEDSTKSISIDKYLPDEETKFQAKLTDRLTKAYDEASMDVLEKQLNSILDEYESKYHKSYSSSTIKKYSVDVAKISSIKIESAPKNYNPKLINTFLNINDNQENNNGLDTLSNNYENGLFMNYDNGDTNGFTNESLNNLNLTMSNSEINTDMNDNIATGLSSNVTNLPSNSNTNQSSKANLNEGVNFGGDVDMNSLFKDSGDLDTNSGVVDDMGDLINFDNDSENEIMGGGNFEQDFLSDMGRME